MSEEGNVETSFLVWTGENVDHYMPRGLSLQAKAPTEPEIVLEAPCSLDGLEWTGESSRAQCNTIERLTSFNS